MAKVNVTEVKVKAGALAALVVSLAATTLLTQFNVEQLPDVLEVPAYSLIASALVWLAGFRARNVAGKLAPSTIEAAEAQVRSKLR